MALPYNTKRYYVDYSNAGRAHTLIMRCAVSVLDVNATTYLGNFLALFDSFLSQSVVTAVRVGAAGDPNSFPISSSLVGTTFGTGTPSLIQSSKSLGFVGRDLNGAFAKVFLFGYKGSEEGNFRVDPAERPLLQPILDALTDTLDAWWSINNQKPVWYGYGNVNVSAYWKERTRKG